VSSSLGGGLGFRTSRGFAEYLSRIST
jgi:hypothetical protein